jgi:murein DD-endopeptidase MepM/ murein hydrolase activator NlpD
LAICGSPGDESCDHLISCKGIFTRLGHSYHIPIDRFLLACLQCLPEQTFLRLSNKSDKGLRGKNKGVYTGQQQGFNPFVFLLLRYIRDNHEFLADEDARKSSDSLMDYLECLKTETIRRYSPVIASNFKCSTIKKRINMLANSRSNRKYKWSYLGILPSIGLMIILFQVPAESKVAQPGTSLEGLSQMGAIETDGLPSVFPLPSEYKNKITWNYNKEAIHPISGEKTTHQGIDIAAPTGTPVFASGSGVVKQAENLGGWGKMVILEHSDGISSLYGHLDQYEVQSGDKVNKGEVIGRVGSTGKSTGPHLHYEVRKEGKPVNPTNFY